MTSYAFIKTMIETRWHNHGSQTNIDYWDNAIAELSDMELFQLISFCMEALGIVLKEDKVTQAVQAIKNAENFFVSSEMVDIEQHFSRKVLYKILDCIVISEFHLDSVLMLPSEIRFEKLGELSKSMDIDTNLIIQVDKQWRGIGAC